MRKLLIILLVMVVATVAQAAMYDDFETDYGNTPPNHYGLSGTNWTTIGSHWFRNNNAYWTSGWAGEYTARSSYGGNYWTVGQLTSAPIAVPDGGISVRVAGQDSGYPSNGFIIGAAPANAKVNVYGSDGVSKGALIASFTAQRDGFNQFRVDGRNRGYNYLIVEGDKSTTVGDWVEMDDVQTSAFGVADLITSFEFGLDGWTATGDFTFATRTNNGQSGMYASEGGQYVWSEAPSGASYSSITSPLITVTRDTLEWTQATSWQGRVQILDAQGGFLANYHAWPTDYDGDGNAEMTAMSADLLGLGLNFGDQFLIRGDTGNENGHGWLAIDYFRMTGVPEPATMILLGAGMLAVLRRKRR